jgi:alpha-aminoadipate carrier protein LysW
MPSGLTAVALTADSPHKRLHFGASVYNTLLGWDERPRTALCPVFRIVWRLGAVIRCPECSAEIDVDEDEVEEGEILSCPECESELEVSQTHPVHLNLISDDMDEEEDEEEESEAGEDGDLLDEEEGDEEEDEE